MGLSTYREQRGSLALALSLMFAGSLSLAGDCRVLAQGQQALPVQVLAQAPATATLQVSGTADRFTILADRADVRSVLSLVFTQAEKDFSLDNNVTGQVTMRLTGQPFPVVLDALCRQTFLKVHQDPATGIFLFSRDDAAVTAAFVQLRSLNSQLAQQLRLLGLDVPYAAQNRVYGYQLGQNTVNGTALPYANVPGAGGFGGPLPNQAMQNSQARRAQPQGVPGPMAEQGPREEARLKADARQRNGDKKIVVQKIAPGDAANDSFAPHDARGAGALSAPTLQLGAANVQAGVDAVQQLRASNNLVELRIPPDQTLPVRDALQQLAAQANVPILIDPQVPSGPKFRVSGTIPARPLPEALNLLAPTARLEWKWVGDTIFVTTTPEFQLFFGDSNVPRATYPPAAPSALNSAPAPSAKPGAAPPGNSKTRLKRKEAEKKRG
ncbi:MAG TPA: hypothetical protein VFB21_14195 [Chthonomonadaceae bacterium]|nr:hypothetical protein [Chthonomonadaceae bacterium]